MLRARITVRRAIAGQVVSVAHLLGRPVRDDAGTRVGRVADVVVRWDAGATHPIFVGVLVGAGRAVVRVPGDDVTLAQHEIRLRSARQLVSRPLRGLDDVELARDVLDRQLVDITGVQVVRAADAYLINGQRGWELAGVDVGWRAFARRLGPKARKCPLPDRAIDWADLHAFVPRSIDAAAPALSGPAAAAGAMGGGMQLSQPASQLTKLRAPEVSAVLAKLSRSQQAEVTALATPSAAVEALRQLDPEHRAALLAELDDSDQSRLQGMLDDGSTP
jgi:sporulation protein YlmC with PRC-barrel domain